MIVYKLTHYENVGDYEEPPETIEIGTYSSMELLEDAKERFMRNRNYQPLTLIELFCEDEVVLDADNLDANFAEDKVFAEINAYYCVMLEEMARKRPLP